MKNKLLKILSAVLIFALCFALAGCGNKNSIESETTSTTEKTNNIGTVKAVIDVAGYGEIYLELYGDIAPITVNNFVNLVNSNFYDGLTFHRVVKDFIIQGGDPEADGTGGSEEKIKGEFYQNNVKNDISHTRGTISMARRPDDPNSASSQFFIVQKDATYLDGGYAAFGRVTEGMDIVDKIIEETPIADTATGFVEKTKQPCITSIKIIE